MDHSLTYFLWRLCLFVLYSKSLLTVASSTGLNIVYILADDLGFNDLSYLGSTQILTPNIDRLAREGVIFARHYSQSLCSPSRASLLTGKYPMHLGMQNGVIKEGEPWGLDLNERTLPQLLKKLGYSTYGIGKWHLGHHKLDYYPVRRGFDSWFGFMGADIDYFNYTTGYPGLFNGEMGRDMVRNTEPVLNITGMYSTDLFAEEAEKVILQAENNVPYFIYFAPNAPHVATYREPFQATPQYLLRPGIQEITDSNRQNYAAMVSGLDNAVGRIHAALTSKNQLQNTIIVFASDNGGQIPQQVIPIQPIGAANNWPFRGGKGMYFEGGIHTPAFVWLPAKLRNNIEPINDDLFHISDWLPTLYEAAGGREDSSEDIDGKSQWKQILGHNDQPARTDILINVDEVAGQAVLVTSNWKLLIGPDKFLQKGEIKWYRPPGTSDTFPRRQESNASIKCAPAALTEKRSCDGTVRYCLYDLTNDPCETDNVANEQPGIMTQLLGTIAQYSKSAIAGRQKPFDARADPKLHNGMWTAWDDSNP
ncbi:arylsulfatase J-like [Paramacrobiotus metropolitanus]|uniref:arylsulfatase J-like n=1 Tax=Paramacrobiotus metropolitanus TaxID=2943436 RepID=UPI00244641E4|nr:arylsulfatase J-like [Paramacrobiotus metropolitanus]